jgi:hypothetical protein
MKQMRTITGRFVRMEDGKQVPASNGVLRLELLLPWGCTLSEVQPVGEGVEQYRIPVTEEMRKRWRAEHHWMPQEELAAAEDEEFKPTYAIERFLIRNIELDENGCISAGTEVVGNDELTVDTTYHATVTVERSTCFSEEIRIAGDEPVDIYEAVLREPEPKLPVPTDREVELAANAAIVRDGTARVGKKNRIGFFAGTIHCPTSRAEAVSLPSIEQGVFGVLGFRLPTDAVINRVSILIEAASKGTLLIALYDASGRKHCETGIDVSQVGPASAIFPTEINLSEGDYFLAWASDEKREAQLRGLGALDQLNLMNASGAPVMGMGKAAPDRTLPETLGRITSNAAAPILAYLKE